MLQLIDVVHNKSHVSRLYKLLYWCFTCVLLIVIYQTYLWTREGTEDVCYVPYRWHMYMYMRYEHSLISELIDMCAYANTT